MKKLNFFLPVLMTFLTHSICSFAAVEDIEQCDSFTNRSKLDGLTPINQVAQDVPSGNTNRKSIDAIIQKHLENAVTKFNASSHDAKNANKYPGNCEQINGARVRGQTTPLEKDFAEAVYKEMTQVASLTSLHQDIFSDAFSKNQHLSQVENIYKNQEKSLLKQGLSLFSGKDSNDKTLAFLVARNELLNPKGVPSKKHPTTRNYVICGDKLTSFFRHGFSLYKQSPRGDTNAASSAINRNTHGERDQKTLDIYYAKAAAEFSGSLFYRDLLNPERGLVSCDKKEGLKINSKNPFQLAKYTNGLWDESLNCTDYKSKSSQKMTESIAKALKASNIPTSNCPVAGAQATSILLANHCKENLENLSSKPEEICSILINPNVGSNTSSQQDQIRINSVKDGTR